MRPSKLGPIAQMGKADQFSHSAGYVCRSIRISKNHEQKLERATFPDRRIRNTPRMFNRYHSFNNVLNWQRTAEVGWPKR